MVECQANIKLLRPGLDKTRLFISLTAGAGTRCMSLLSSSPILGPAPWRGRRTLHQRNRRKVVRKVSMRLMMERTSLKWSTNLKVKDMVDVRKEEPLLASSISQKKWWGGVMTIGSWWAAGKKKHLAASNEQETSFILFLAEDSVNCGKKIGPLARNCRRTLLTQLAYRF